MKCCTKCGESKPLSDFNKRAVAKDGLSSACRLCVNKTKLKTYHKNPAKTQATTKAWKRNNRDRLNAGKRAQYRRNPDTTRNQSLKKNYGITVAQYEQMLSSQLGRCAICQTEKCDSGRRLAVDHCHASGKVRSLLCKRCNTALGNFRDSPQLLHNAILYLQQHAA